MGCVGGNPALLPRVLRLLSRDSPSGAMKAVLRKAGGTSPGEEKQFLEVSLHGTRQWAIRGSVLQMRLCWGAGNLMPRCPQVWEKNRKLKSFNLSVLEKHGLVYEDGRQLTGEQTGWTGGAARAQGSP